MLSALQIAGVTYCRITGPLLSWSVRSPRPPPSARGIPTPASACSRRGRIRRGPAITTAAFEQSLVALNRTCVFAAIILITVSNINPQLHARVYVSDGLGIRPEGLGRHRFPVEEHAASRVSLEPPSPQGTAKFRSPLRSQTSISNPGFRLRECFDDRTSRRTSVDQGADLRSPPEADSNPARGTTDPLNSR